MSQSNIHISLVTDREALGVVDVDAYEAAAKTALVERFPGAMVEFQPDGGRPAVRVEGEDAPNEALLEVAERAWRDVLEKM